LIAKTSLKTLSIDLNPNLDEELRQQKENQIKLSYEEVISYEEK
jgi:hypothetical protein